MSISANNSLQKEPIFSITFECDAIFSEQNIDKIQKAVFRTLALLPAALIYLLPPLIISANLMSISLGNSLRAEALVISSLALAALCIYEIIKNLFTDLYENPAYLNKCKENTVNLSLNEILSLHEAKTFEK